MPMESKSDWSHPATSADEVCGLVRLMRAACERGLGTKFFVYLPKVSVTPQGEGSDEPSGRSVTFTLCALVQYPYIQIADLRTESSTLQPQSMMWTQFQVDGINELYQGEVADVERKFQAAIGIDDKKRLVRQLKPFQMLFGTAAVESGPTVVYLALSNPGYLPIRFSFQTPENLNLENVPYW
ncbi:CFAP65 [Symbiodinium natans]|uniref:CFAP65 protein n=1 Tax=Symbiodinium natans TaxID=878477 RepID=A0A812MLV7_9DINO|nr:CFAP65 [Symbiodinium natans]